MRVGKAFKMQALLPDKRSRRRDLVASSGESAGKGQTLSVPLRDGKDCALRSPMRSESSLENRTRIRFEELATKWRRETRYAPLDKVLSHRAYQRIVGMGKTALPYILADLQEYGGLWHWALIAITRARAPHYAHGSQEVRQFWLRWGQKHGYL